MVSISAHSIFIMTSVISVICASDLSRVSDSGAKSEKKQASSTTSAVSIPGTNLFQIEGKVVMPKGPGLPNNWQTYTRILANYGQLIGLIREDGGFVINNVPPGSYVVEVASRDYIFEPFRVDITSKGKVRGRKLNFLQPAQVQQVPYPLKFVARQPVVYFRKREEWRLTDMIMNPMVLMMVLPLLLIMVIPKLINTDDPEVQKEMQQSLQMPKYDMPELSEVMANWFGGGKKPKPKPKLKSGRN